MKLIQYSINSCAVNILGQHSQQTLLWYYGDGDMKSRKDSFETALRDLGDSLIDPTLEQRRQSDDTNADDGLMTWLDNVRSHSGNRISENELRTEREEVESSRRSFLGGDVI